MSDTKNITSEVISGQADFAPGPLSPIGQGIDFTRPLRTKGSKTPARVVAIVHQFERPVLVALDPGAGRRSMLCDSVLEYGLDGKHGYGRGSNVLDLENYDPEGK